MLSFYARIVFRALLCEIEIGNALSTFLRLPVFPDTSTTCGTLLVTNLTEVCTSAKKGYKKAMENKGIYEGDEAGLTGHADIFLDDEL